MNQIQKLITKIVTSHRQQKLKKFYEENPNYEYDGIHDLPWEAN